MYVSDENSNTVSVIDKSRPRVVATVPTGTRPHHITHSPDGRLVHVAEYGTNKVGVIDTATDALRAAWSTGPDATRTHATWPSCDGQPLHTANTVVDTVAALDARTGAVLGNLAVGDNPGEVLVAAASPHLARPLCGP